MGLDVQARQAYHTRQSVGDPRDPAMRPVAFRKHRGDRKGRDRVARRKTAKASRAAVRILEPGVGEIAVRPHLAGRQTAIDVFESDRDQFRVDHRLAREQRGVAAVRIVIDQPGNVKRDRHGGDEETGAGAAQNVADAMHRRVLLVGRALEEGGIGGVEGNQSRRDPDDRQRRLPVLSLGGVDRKHPNRFLVRGDAAQQQLRCQQRFVRGGAGVCRGIFRERSLGLRAACCEQQKCAEKNRRSDRTSLRRRRLRLELARAACAAPSPCPTRR